MVKVTFTVDERTVETLRQAAARAKKPQSAVVREAIRDYADRLGRLGDDERRRLLRIVDRMMDRPARRTDAAVDAELVAIRAARKAGGRRAGSK
jgi:hypothetical protein